MTRAWLFGLLFACGCAAEMERVEVTEPSNANVVIVAGLGSGRVETKTPFVGNFEAVSLSDWAGYNLTFDLDAAGAARYGAAAPIKLYGHLFVGKQTALSRTQTLVLKMPEEELRALVTGRRVEIETFVTDPHVSPPLEVARLTLRTTPF